MTGEGSTRGAPGRGQPASLLPWLETLRSVIAAVETSDAHEVEVRTPGIRITLRRAPAALGPEQRLGASFDAEPLADALHMVRAPLTGIWYDSPSPGGAPFVRVGDLIGAGAAIGLIETMKVFNEVHSDAGGVVKQILVRRGDLVLAHAPLIALEVAVATTEPVVS